MRKTLYFLLLLLLASRLSAQMRVPRHVYEVDQLEEARAAAVKGNKTLSFVLTNPNTRCGLCIRASEEAFSQLRRHSEVVLLRSGETDGTHYSEWVSPPLHQQLKSPDLGRFIPKAVVSTTDMRNILGFIKYEDMKNSRNFQSLARQVRTFSSDSESLPEPPEELNWILKGGRFYRGSFVSLEEDRLTLLITDSGNKLTLPLSDFAEGTMQYARLLSGGEPHLALAPIPAGMPMPMELWTSSDGVRQIKAQFISLQGDTITLLNESGNTLRFTIDLLDEESQRLAGTRALLAP